MKKVSDKFHQGALTRLILGAIYYCETQKTREHMKISGMLIVWWPITIMFRTRKQTSKPETNYCCCLWFSFLMPYWLFPHNTVTFYEYFWCSRFTVKLEKVGPTSSIFNPCPSLPSVATDDRKQFQWVNIVLNNKTGPFFWNSVDVKKRFSFLKDSKYHNIAPLSTGMSIKAAGVFCRTPNALRVRKLSELSSRSVFPVKWL